MAASLIHYISTGCRDHLEKVMKIEEGHRNGCQLDSLHFYRVPWPEYHKDFKLVSDARGGEFKASFRLYSEEAVRQVFS